MAGEGQETGNWLPSWKSVKDTLRATFRPSGEIAKAKVGEAFEAGKEKIQPVKEAVTNITEAVAEFPELLQEASKNVLKEYSKKAFDAFDKFPNKIDFATAAFTGAVGVAFGGAGAAIAATSIDTAANISLGIPSPELRVVGGAFVLVASLLPVVGSGVLFKAWHDESFKSEAVNK